MMGSRKNKSMEMTEISEEEKSKKLVEEMNLLKEQSENVCLLWRLLKMSEMD